MSKQQIQWAVAAIKVGARHRRDLGDIEALAASSEQVGLLQPLTLTADGVLVCGARRLAAVKLLGWRQVEVTIRADISTALQLLMAENEDAANTKEYTVVEKADLYAELLAIETAEAARRKRWASPAQPSIAPTTASSVARHPSGKFPEGSPGDAREHAAAKVGGISYKTAEKVLAIRAIAADASEPQPIRDYAARSLAALDGQKLAEGDPARSVSVDGVCHGIEAMRHLATLKRASVDSDLPASARKYAAEQFATLKDGNNGAPRSNRALNTMASAAVKKVWNLRNRHKNPPATDAASDATAVENPLPKPANSGTANPLPGTGNLASEPADLTPEDRSQAPATASRAPAFAGSVREKGNHAPATEDQTPVAAKKTVQDFLYTWGTLGAPTTAYYAVTIAREVPVEKWERFEQTVADAARFTREVNQARATLAACNRVVGETEHPA